MFILCNIVICQQQCEVKTTKKTLANSHHQVRWQYHWEWSHLQTQCETSTDVALHESLWMAANITINQL